MKTPLPFVLLSNICHLEIEFTSVLKTKTKLDIDTERVRWGCVHALVLMWLWIAYAMRMNFRWKSNLMPNQTILFWIVLNEFADNMCVYTN